MKAILILVGMLLLAPAARADEATVTLKNAPGRDAVESNCNACHSLDYIQTNSPFPSAAVWDGSVKKMINVFGAPITPADAKTITDYLVKNYGS